MASSERRKHRASPSQQPPSVGDPFGADGCVIYDDDARSMPMRYRRAKTVQNKVICGSLAAAAPAHRVVLDLGAGTGNDGLVILKKESTALYVGIDRSESMISLASHKMECEGLKDRSLFLCHDLLSLSRDWLREELGGVGSRVRVVLSSMTLHHYDLKQKAAVYALAYDTLVRGGRLVLTDLFASDLEDLARYALERELKDIKRMRRRSLHTADPARYEISTMSEHHYVQSNRPQSLLAEIKCLRSAGFGLLDVAFRDGQLAVIVAERSE